MSDADRTNMEHGTTERDPEMVSGTTGMGSDLDASMGGLSGSVSPSTAGSDAIDNDPGTVGADVDMSGAMGATGGMNINNAPPLDSDAVGLRGPSSGDADAGENDEGTIAAGVGEDAGDIMTGYGSDTGDPSAGTGGAPTLDSDAMDIEGSSQDER